MTHLPLARVTVLVLALSCLHARAGAQPADAKGLSLFENKIRPVLVKECYQCHSAEAVRAGKLKAQLLVDTRAGMQKGGESGAAVVPGKFSLMTGPWWRP